MYNPVGWQSDSGGETYFTSGVGAMERMDPDITEELRHCQVVYMRSPNDEFPDESRRVDSGPSYMTDDGTRRIGFGLTRRMPRPECGISSWPLNTRWGGDATDGFAGIP
ncbi:MAG: hypothetical protein CM1200mP20_01920 [Pseudomonadota bacterium]|nr:MAG: hypothetical protein CM1200mP20_01920 [Pseudomonadota bacterium]